MSLRLSPHVLPQPRLGIHPLRPQNMTDGADRVRYANHILEIGRAIAKRGAIEEARRWRDEVPFGRNLIMWNEHDGHVHLDPLPELANALTFSIDALGILFRDGRERDDGKMVYLPTADATPDVLRLIRLLHRGLGEAELLADPSAEEVGFDGDLLTSLKASRVIESGAVPTPAPATDFAIEWMGHAWVRAVGPHGSVWFDPFTPPRIAWTLDEHALFDAYVPDHFLLRDYGPSAHQLTLDELPIPDAIFITHQDSDHMDLGMLALVPPEVPIYVPVNDRDKPWQVDLVAVLRAVLGADRNVIALEHDRTLTVAGIRITAFPFLGEFPAALPHRWNGYFVELPEQAWALCADSAVTELHVEWLRDRRGRADRPLGIMVNGLTERAIVDGYRDTFDEVASFNRLYSWYLPPARLFDPVPACGLPLEVLKRFVAEVGLAKVFFYAHGNLPWYRMQDSLLHRSHVGSHTLGLWNAMTKAVEDQGAKVVRLQHGIPYM